jgi:RNA polymerase sigma-32 factor
MQANPIKTEQALSALMPGQNLDSYIQNLKTVALLSVEEEQALAKKLQHDNDVDAARRLILSHLRFVVHIAYTYRGYGLPHADLIQEGNIGLMKAVKRFDPERGVRLVSFAVHWIRAEIHEYILRNWRIVKVATTKAQRKLFFNLRARKKTAQWLSESEAQDIAEDLGVKLKDVYEMESRLTAHDLGFDYPADNNDDEDTLSPVTYLQTDDNPEMLAEQLEWDEHSKNRLYQALNQLDERSQRILQHRWLDDKKATLQELSNTYQVSAERIRQIEQNALKKLKQNLAVFNA